MLAAKLAFSSVAILRSPAHFVICPFRLQHAGAQYSTFTKRGSNRISRRITHQLWNASVAQCVSTHLVVVHLAILIIGN